jgi:hypothetical protein
MRGSDEQNGALFSYVNLEDRVPARHPLRVIRKIVNAALARLNAEFAGLYASEERPSIPPEWLLRAVLRRHSTSAGNVSRSTTVASSGGSNRPDSAPRAFRGRSSLAAAKRPRDRS